MPWTRNIARKLTKDSGKQEYLKKLAHHEIAEVQTKKGEARKKCFHQTFKPEGVIGGSSKLEEGRISRVFHCYKIW